MIDKRYISAVFGRKNNVLNDASITLGGELGLNFFLSPNELDVEDGAKVVLDGPEGKREFILSETKKESDGEYKLTYKLKAIFADRNVTLTLVDADGEKLDLNLGSGAEVENDVFTYSIYDYVAYAKENFPAWKTLDLVNAM